MPPSSIARVKKEGSSNATKRSESLKKTVLQRATSGAAKKSSGVSMRELMNEIEELKSQVVSLTQDVNTMNGVLQSVESTLEYLKQEQSTKYDNVVSTIQELMASVKTAFSQQVPSPSGSGAGKETQDDSTVIPAPREYTMVEGKRKSNKIPVRKPHILQFVIKPTEKGMKHTTALALYCNMRNERTVALDNPAARLRETYNTSMLEISAVERRNDAENQDLDEVQSQTGSEFSEAAQSDEDENPVPEYEECDQEERMHSGQVSQGVCADVADMTWASVPESERKITVLSYEASVLEVVKIDLSTCEAHWAAAHILEEGWNNRLKNAKAKASVKVGPLSYLAAFVMERAVGELKKRINSKRDAGTNSGNVLVDMAAIRQRKRIGDVEDEPAKNPEDTHK
ncbi:hypothetical protein BJV82DRAFT_710606 [Fennellomyces sp. T-0311]|nr:hypothetical protein BJV82DRAFT_710606 [Fennellomyces sp. T-0311]